MANEMNKVPCGGFMLGEGLALSEDGKTLTATGVGGSQADWNQNDETAADYVKNRPGGYEGYVPTIVAQGNFSNGVQQNAALSYFYLSPTNPLIDVKIDDGGTVRYSAIYSTSEGFEYWEVGDKEFTEIDFYLILSVTPVDGAFVTFKFKDQQSHNCVVSPYILDNVLIDEKWLPNGNVKNLFAQQGYKTSGATIGGNNMGNGGLIIGYNCNLQSGSINSILGVGENLVESYSDAYLVVGHYNADSKVFPHNPLLVVGNGTSDTARHNAFMVTKTGELIVPSSTKDSSKYFAITVDDTGTIKATEVTG